MSHKNWKKYYKKKREYEKKKKTRNRKITKDRKELKTIPANALVGRFISHEKGFGFVCVEGREEDIFIPKKDTLDAFEGDQVTVICTKSPIGKRQEGKIIKIISHEITEVVGTYQESKHFGFVIPDNPKIQWDIFIPMERKNGATEGHKVVCRLLTYGNKNAKPEGEILEILGHKNDPGVDILSIVKGYGIPMEFSEKVLQQGERVAKEVSEADCLGRCDLTDTLMITIDGEDAKDLDDAVSLEIDGSDYILGVHIADVANYVQENSALDKEALKRGTSVYLVDRVIPMLPHVLSNGMCSLNQNQKRLALSCRMRFNQKGQMINYEILESVIIVNQRFSYTTVQKILEDSTCEEAKKYHSYVTMIYQMKKLSDILRDSRENRGAIDFDFQETKIIVDEEGKVLELQKRERNDATKLIEDFMLAANETVAKHFYDCQKPFLYRVHGTPDTEKVEKLNVILGEFGFHLTGSKDDISPKEIQQLLNEIKGSSEEEFISRLVLRSMQQAKYSYDCTGHYGLAASHYCHFTSPIRRYPDLQIHRIIKENLRNRFYDHREAHYEEILPKVASATSTLERRAQEVEREVEKQKKVQYMSQFLHQEFEGRISGVTAWGCYVELDNTVEGLVSIKNMKDDEYEFIEERYEMVGRSRNKHWRMGQMVRVRLIGVDEINRTIDFEFVEEENE